VNRYIAVIQMLISLALTPRILRYSIVCRLLVRHVYVSITGTDAPGQFSRLDIIFVRPCFVVNLRGRSAAARWRVSSNYRFSMVGERIDNTDSKPVVYEVV